MQKLIAVFSDSAENIKLISHSANNKSLSVQYPESLALWLSEARRTDSAVAVVDLSSGDVAMRQTLRLLSEADCESLPPVLFLLNSADEIETLSEECQLLNQDYAFLPADENGLGERLQLLCKLGERRRLTMETAITDRLTGLSNRKYFLRRLEEELYHSRRYQRSCVVMLLAVDFSAVQGRLSENSGAAVMRSVASYLQGRLRRSDIAARYRWDDFALLLPDTSPDDLQHVARGICGDIEAISVADGHARLRLRAVCGSVVLGGEPEMSVLDVLEKLEDSCFAERTQLRRQV